MFILRYSNYTCEIANGFNLKKELSRGVRRNHAPEETYQLLGQQASTGDAVTITVTSVIPTTNKRFFMMRFPSQVRVMLSVYRGTKFVQVFHIQSNQKPKRASE